MKYKFLKVAGAAVALFAIPASSATAEIALVTGDLNMRAGPGTRYPVVTVLPRGSQIEVVGCLENYSWCDAIGPGARGWVSGRYLAFAYNDRRVRLPELAGIIALPLIGFSIGDYWGSHYRDRPWYHRGPDYGWNDYGDAPRWRPRDRYSDRRWRHEWERSPRMDNDRGQIIPSPEYGPGGVRLGRDPAPIDQGQFP